MVSQREMGRVVLRLGRLNLSGYLERLQLNQWMRDSSYQDLTSGC